MQVLMQVFTQVLREHNVPHYGLIYKLVKAEGGADFTRISLQQQRDAQPVVLATMRSFFAVGCKPLKGIHLIIDQPNQPI